ncbi:Sap-r [Trypoxylus dichotomus]
MKYFIYFICFLVYAINAATADVPPVSVEEPRSVSSKHLLGSKECTWGPSYWCSNLTAAAGCRAVKHCIQTVWEHQKVPEDSDSVCDICLKMVTQARDQLLSNETEEEIEQVFEGSCNLIPIKLVRKECIKLVDDFVPELVDTLASQMNPQVVCSVAGLCNSARIDNLIAEYEAQDQKKTAVGPSRCDSCHTVVGVMERRLEKMSKDEVLQSLLRVCGRLGSFSDACSNIIVTYFSEIYERLQNGFNSDNVCILTGECAAQFHTHVEITPLSKVGFVPVSQEGDDLPCDLCEQLVNHLRDLLIANTTEIEFQKVLQGLCNQTGQFRNECLSLVSEYYPVIYDFLVSELNGTVACAVIGLCPQSRDADEVPIAPLLPAESATKVYNLLHDNEDDLARVNVQNNGLSVKIMSKPESLQLPIERLFPQVPETYNRQVCVFCQYFLHYVQTAITDPTTEEKVKEIVEKACNELPSSVNGTCRDFVETYGDAVIALLAQEIDPSTICPLIKACPGASSDEVEIFRDQGVGTDSCPLCLFAVTELEEMVKNENTEANIRKALDSLCSHLSGSIALECQDFVNTYADSLINMLVDDLKPQQVCVYIKLCNTTLPSKPLVATPPDMDDVEILSNEILDNTVNGQVLPQKQVQNNGPCILCEFAMDKIQQLLKNNNTEAEIKHVVENICIHLPKSISPECTSFVDKYADLVIQLLIGSMDPEDICTYVGLCTKQIENFQNGLVIDIPAEDLQSVSKRIHSPQCTICKLIMAQVERFIIGPKTKKDVIDGLYDICDALPATEEKSCENFIGKYGDAIADMILAALQPGEICSVLMVCGDVRNAIEEEITECSLCEAVYFNFNYLQQTRGRKVLPEHVCNPMTKKYVKPCMKLMEKHAFAIGMYSSSNEDTTILKLRCHKSRKKRVK